MLLLLSVTQSGIMRAVPAKGSATYLGPSQTSKYASRAYHYWKPVERLQMETHVTHTQSFN